MRKTTRRLANLRRFGSIGLVFWTLTLVTTLPVSVASPRRFGSIGRIFFWTLTMATTLPASVRSFSVSCLPRVSAVGHRALKSHSHSDNQQEVPTQPQEEEDNDKKNVVKKTLYRPLFDFSNSSAAEQFARIDDVIMGGVSTSTFVDAPGKEYAKWFGQCRIEGGGFCGIRTRPFEEALNVPSDTKGFYLTCRLVSDSEPERRIWKLTTRSKQDRGEQLYQAMYTFGNEKNGNEKNDPTTTTPWSTVKVPFDSFRLVKGPRIIPNGEPLNSTGGLFQIGMTMSKFVLAENTRELESFRPGFFEYQLKTLGFYAEEEEEEEKKEEPQAVVSLPKVLSEQQDRKTTPLLLKVLRPVSKLIFSEASQRRKVALQLLREKRQLGGLEAIRFGFANRARSRGVISAVGHLMAILTVDSLRAVVFTALKVALVWPSRLLFKTVHLLSKPFVSKKKKESESKL